MQVDETQGAPRPYIRDRAHVLLDAFLSDVPGFSDEIDEARGIARADYNTRFKARMRYHFRLATRQPWARRPLRDAYCIYCGEMIVRASKQRIDFLVGETRRHTTICALHMLTGMREPVSPDVRNLPSEAAAS